MRASEVIRRAKRPERTVELFLGDERVAEYEELERQRGRAAGQADDSLDGGPVAAIDDRLERLREEMADSLMVVRLRGLGRLEYAKLLGEHPPRRGEDGEVIPADRLGYNQETYWPALVRASWVEPALEPADLDYLLDELMTVGQFDQVSQVALLVNRGRVDVPFLRAASTPRTSSASA